MLKWWALAGGLLATAAYGQKWEVGAIGGFGYAPNLTVTRTSESASAGLKNGGVAGVFGGEDTYNYIGGEARYLYRYSNFKVSSGPTSVTFGGHTHIIEANFMVHFRPREASLRPFVAFGGGVEILQGTGTESASQPLARFAALTATRELLPVAGVGGGVKLKLASRLRLRVEVRDYLSPVPSKVIAPAPGSSLGGIFNDIIGMGALSYTW